MHYTLNKMSINIYINIFPIFIQILMHTLQTPACPCTHSHIQQFLTHPSPPSATLPHSPIPPLFTDLLNLHSNKRDKGSWTAFSLSPLLKGNKHTYTRLQPVIPQTQAPSTCTDLHHYITVYIWLSLLSLLLVRVRFSSFRCPRQDPYKIWKLQHALLKHLAQL